VLPITKLGMESHNIFIIYSFYIVYIYIYYMTYNDIYIYFHVFGVEHPAISQFNESAFGSAKTSLGATQPFFAWTSSRGECISLARFEAELYRNWLRRNRKMRHGRIWGSVTACSLGGCGRLAKNDWSV
jgi:hypothetical protein